MLSRNASLWFLAALFGSALLVASCAKPATTTTTTTCNSGQTECSGSCINVQTDNQNCGSCGTTCASGSSCQAGKCACTGGFVSCGGTCVQSNPQHCGNSCTACSNGDVCDSTGTCSSTCSSGTKCSDGTCSGPTNTADCGTCGNACGAGSSCVSGTCGCSVSGQQLCGGSCIDTTSNNSNCGSCGHACSGAQTCSNGTCTTINTTGTGGSGSGTGGTTGTGGAKGGSTGTGGSGSGTGGTTGTGGSTGAGGSTGSGGSGSRACGAPASGDVVADFEEGFNQNVVQGSRQGWWSAFGDTTGSETPAAGTTSPVAAASVSAPLPSGDTCDMFAMHSTGTGHSGTSAYVGFGTSFAAVLPPPSGTTTKTRNPYDVSTYDGLSFNIKSGSGTAPPIWVEFQNTENVPTPDGTAQYSGVDQYNTRGMLLTTVGTSWTKVYVPFATLAPRYLPNLTESDCSNGSVVCQAPPWDSKNTLGFQFGIYPQFTVQPFTSSTSLNYDLWVDDVTLYKGDTGLGTLSGGGTTFADKTYAGCTKPTGAAGKYLIPMYNKWKSTFVTGSGSSTKVIRPENGNDTVSEGIGYGMLIAVYVGDQTLFDGLWGYEQSQRTAGTLMNWCIPAGGGSCSASGGSATDADEDMAFALIEAGKRWGGSYASSASTMIKDIYAHDIDTAAKLPNGGSNFGSGMQTNPSYWAPAYYKVFAGIDTADDWNTVANNTYTALSAIAGKSTGNAAGALVPAWCSGSNCGNVAGSGYTDGGVYQYDAHRVPWRFGIDKCWNSATGASTFLTKNSGFFANIAKTGIGRIEDIYTLGGTANGDAEPNSMSIIGTAGVGAMAAGNASFANAAWQFLLDASYSPASFIKDSGGKISYTYFNATVGLLSALTLSGNFYPM
jgi:endo-1,4-beta-D-glucanase Y